MSYKRLVYLGLLIFIISIAGCSDDDSPTASGGGGTGGGGPVTNPSFATDILAIIDANGCAGSSCHGTAQQANLSLTAGDAYGDLVGVNSTEVPSLMRVDSTSSANSYLIQKVEGTASVGTRMPPPPRSALTADQIQTLKNWIDQGAQNN